MGSSFCILIFLKFKKLNVCMHGSPYFEGMYLNTMFKNKITLILVAFHFNQSDCQSTAISKWPGSEVKYKLLETRVHKPSMHNCILLNQNRDSLENQIDILEVLHYQNAKIHCILIMRLLIKHGNLIF